MRRFLAFLFIFLPLGVTTVYATNYPSARIKRYATNTPRQVENNVATLTRHLIRPLDDDYDKAKMIAFWIASHINYDEYLYSNGKTSKLIKGYRGQSPQQLLNSRVGICGDFAELFNEMCQKAGIRSQKVHGYVYPRKAHLTNRQKRANYSHAWNYFYYKGKKIYVDTTFMAGGTTGTRGGSHDFAHNSTLRKIKSDNRHRSRVNDFDDKYFDFTYKDEERMGYKREERP